MSRNLIRTILVLILAAACCGSHGDEDDTRVMRLEVIDPYVEMHTGPGRGYPIFYVIEQGEQVEVLTRRPDWYEVRSANGRVGWVTTRQIARTIQSTGEPADLPTVGFGDYLKDSWRVGFSSGRFSKGELKGSDLYRATVGYRGYSWLGLELEGGKIFGSDVKGQYYNFNISLEPFSRWRASPALVLGTGVMDIQEQPKLVPLEVDDSKFDNYALRLNYYAGRNFVISGEYRWYDVKAETKTVRLEGWQIGFNTFF